MILTIKLESDKPENNMPSGGERLDLIPAADLVLQRSELGRELSDIQAIRAGIWDPAFRFPTSSHFFEKDVQEAGIDPAKQPTATFDRLNIDPDLRAVNALAYARGAVARAELAKQLAESEPGVEARGKALTAEVQSRLTDTDAILPPFKRLLAAGHMGIEDPEGLLRQLTADRRIYQQALEGGERKAQGGISRASGSTERVTMALHNDVEISVPPLYREILERMPLFGEGSIGSRQLFEEIGKADNGVELGAVRGVSDGIDRIKEGLLRSGVVIINHLYGIKGAAEYSQLLVNPRATGGDDEVAILDAVLRSEGLLPNQRELYTRVYGGEPTEEGLDNLLRGFAGGWVRRIANGSSDSELVTRVKARITRGGVSAGVFYRILPNLYTHRVSSN